MLKQLLFQGMGQSLLPGQRADGLLGCVISCLPERMSLTAWLGTLLFSPQCEVATALVVMKNHDETDFDDDVSLLMRMKCIPIEDQGHLKET